MSSPAFLEITSDSPDFPPSLAKVRPVVSKLFYKGKWAKSLFDHTLGVVGSRRMTSYGQRVIEKFLPVLIEAKITIVSGGMYGVDIAAHQMCTDFGGKTVAVLGWGIASTDDTEIYRLSPKVIENHGLIMSEYDGFQKPQLWMFPQRNRIIAGLSQAVLVVEAGLGSGSIVTAKWAAKFGVPILAVPGPITSTVSEGANFLIKSGMATAVTTVDDVLEVLGIVKEKNNVQLTIKSENNQVLTLLSQEERSVDELAAILKKSVSEVASEISMLELQGKVRHKAGKYYI